MNPANMPERLQAFFPPVDGPSCDVESPICA